MKQLKEKLPVTIIVALTLWANAYGATSYSDDFDDGNADGWTSAGGSWSVSNSGESSYYYQQTDLSAESFSYAGQISWTDYSFEARVKRIATNGYGSCDIVGRSNGTDFYLVQIGPSNAQIWNVTAANSWVNVAKANTTNTLDTWYTYKLEMVGDVIRVYKDGIEIISVTDPNPILSGQIGFRAYRINCRFDDVVVTNLGAPWPSGQASGPNPPDEETDVPRDVALSWTPGESVSPINGHIVYFSEVFDDVSNGVGGITQSASSYVVTQRLSFDTTYYWRVDEVNGPPDFTVHRGDIWSFTTESIAYPIDGRNITATASDSFNATTGPEKTVDGSGLDANGLHSDQQTDMWMTGLTGPQPSWIRYEFDKVYKLHEMWIWNYNQNIEPLVGFGLKDVTVEYSPNGSDWTVLNGVPEFAQGPGVPDYAHNTTVSFGGATVKYVKITASDNWGSLTQYGLSEVRFFRIPVSAREPSPDTGSTDVHPDVTLGWRAGREAVRHNVFLSSDQQAVIDGTAPIMAVDSPNCTSSLDLASTYYWRVDEVNDAEMPSTWQGDLWSLSTQEYLVVDDFESYNDTPAGEEGSNLVYETWIDGFGTTTNGSTIGYTEAFQPSLEKTEVYDGKQSVPLFYNNTTTSLSEITANVTDLQSSTDWSKHSIQGLTLRFYGDPANALQQMYVKINGIKVLYDGSAENLRRPKWQMWYIDLASLGVNLSNVATLTIGFERIGGAGGQGKVLLDGIRLYSYNRQLITPVDPETTGLQAQYQFEGNTNDSSANGRNGTIRGGPLFVAGQVGQAVSLDGIDDYVNIDGYKGILADAAGVQHEFTLSAWIKTAVNGDIIAWGTNAAGQRMNFRVDTVLRVEHGNGNVRGTNGPSLLDGQWHHVAATVPQGGRIMDVRLYVDGSDVTPASTTTAAFNLTANVDVAIGMGGAAGGRFFTGLIDEVRMYDRALSPEEITWLVGMTLPFDKPF